MAGSSKSCAQAQFTLLAHGPELQQLYADCVDTFATPQGDTQRDCGLKCPEEATPHAHHSAGLTVWLLPSPLEQLPQAQDGVDQPICGALEPLKVLCVVQLVPQAACMVQLPHAQDGLQGGGECGSNQCGTLYKATCLAFGWQGTCKAYTSIAGQPFSLDCNVKR